MTYTATLNSPDHNVVLPNGTRYQGSAAVVLSDDEYAQLSPRASSLLTAVYLGGDVGFRVTVAAGITQLVLPDGLRHKSGDVVTLSDSQYSTISPAAVSALFSSVVQVEGP